VVIHLGLARLSAWGYVGCEEWRGSATVHLRLCICIVGIVCQREYRTAPFAIIIPNMIRLANVTRSSTRSSKYIIHLCAYAHMLPANDSSVAKICIHHQRPLVSFPKPKPNCSYSYKYLLSRSLSQAVLPCALILNPLRLTSSPSTHYSKPHPVSSPQSTYSTSSNPSSYHQSLS
jgi:hypothetical protein